MIIGRFSRSLLRHHKSDIFHRNTVQPLMTARSPMSSYKLYYFPIKGRAEMIRWLFEIGGLQYQDIRVPRDENWPQFKTQCPFGEMPVLEVEGEKIAQSNAIARFIARRIGMAGRTDLEAAKIDMIADFIEYTIQPVGHIHHASGEYKKELIRRYDEEQKPEYFSYLERILETNKSGYFVADTMTWADVFLPNALAFMRYVGDVSLDDFPHVKALEQRVTSHPKVADWIKRRPLTRL